MPNHPRHSSSPDPKSPFLSTTHWLAPPASVPFGTTPLPSPAAVDGTWQPLGQSWRTDPPAPDFEPGWARIFWQAEGLGYEGVFLGEGANRARRLNERAWELGDVAEVFVQRQGAGEYLELHITPENMRLQLRWQLGDADRVRAKTAALESMMVAQPDWVESNAQAGPDFWAFRVFIPAPQLGFDRLDSTCAFRTAICRYHYRSATPLVSSTAPLKTSRFHSPDNWHLLTLVDR